MLYLLHLFTPFDFLCDFIGWTWRKRPARISRRRRSSS